MTRSEADGPALVDIHVERLALLTNVLNRIPAMIGYWDAELRNLVANDAYIDFFGQEPGRMQGIHIRELLGEELFARNLPFMERALAGEAQLFDRTIIDPEGRERHTQASYIPDEVDGVVRGFFVLVTEITERRLAEEALRRSEENLDTVLRSLGEAVVAYDAAGAVTRLNPAAEQLTGWRAEEALGQPFASVVQLEDEQRQLIDREGRRYHVAVTGSPIHDRDGTSIGRVKIIRDVSEDQRVRQQLARSAEMLERTGHIARVGGWEVDVATRERYWLPEVYRILDLDPAEMPQLEEVLATSLSPAAAQTIRDALTAGYATGAPWDLELPMTTVAGRSIWVRSKGEAVVEDGAVVRLVGTFQDITERKELEERLIRSTRLEAVGRLAGGVAHDFNNMLGIILGRTELAMGNDDLASIRRDLAEIKVAAERSAELTRQLLTFARQQTVSPVVLSANDAVEELFALLQRFVGEDVLLSLRPAASAWNVEIDRSQLGQILTNLCINAREALVDRDGAAVAIQIDNVVTDGALHAHGADVPAGEYVCISVIDNGSGIDEQTFGQMFEPFSTTKQFGTNSGLGLATVIGAVSQSGGFVVPTTQLGVGTRFDVYLPRHVGPIGESGSTAPAVTADPVNGTVLVVEDEPSLRALVVRVLDAAGYRVFDAASAAVALDVLRQHPGEVRVLLTDVIMPGGNGVELARAVAALEPAVVPVYMSGYAADIVATDDPGSVHFVQKPFTVAALGDAIRRAMRQALAGS